MRIIEIREKTFPVAVAMRNAAFDFSEMTTSVVAVVTDQRRQGRPIIGYAFNSTGRYACGGPMRARFIPRLLRADPDALMHEDGNFDPARALSVMMQGEKPGGHSERSIPIGTIETALWDAAAKAADMPAWQLLANRFRGGAASTRVFCYVGGGWYKPGETRESLQDELRAYLDAGYTQIKIKVGGLSLDDDLRRIGWALEVVGEGANLAVDANAAMAPATAVAYAGALSPLGLRWFEEPCDPLDLAGFADLSRRYAPPLGTGENLFSPQDVRNLLAFGGFRSGHDILQVDPVQAYGLATCEEIAGLLDQSGGTRRQFFPHGGNLMSFSVAAGLGLGGCESYPDVFGAFGGFTDEMSVSDGFIRAHQRPGHGFEGHAGFQAITQALAV